MFLSYMKARKNYDANSAKSEILDKNGHNTSALYSASENATVLGYDPIRELQDHLGGAVHLSFIYGRYWHGYIVLYRPLLILFNISQIRLLLLAVFTVLFVWFLRLVHLRFGKTIAFIFAASLVCSGYFTASFSLQNAPVFLIMMISAVILTKRIDGIKDYNLYVFAAACAAGFADYLTVPMITLGMLSCLYILKQLEEGQDWLRCCRTAALSTAAWFAGYGGTWLCKWVLYDLTVNSGNCLLLIGEGTKAHLTAAGDFSMLSTALKQLAFRTSRTNSEAGIYADKYIYVTLNILGRASLYTLFSAGILLYMHNFKAVIDGFNKTAVPFLLTALLPALWYTVLANHTEQHYYFTYRLSFMYMLGLLLAVNEILFPGKMRPVSDRHDG